MIKTLPASAEGARDTGSVPGLGRSPRIGDGNSLQYVAWEIPWTEEPGGLQSMGLPKVRPEFATKQQQQQQVMT